MKTKLLKHLRKYFYIIYYPADKTYKVYYRKNKYEFNVDVTYSKASALGFYRNKLLAYARYYYRKNCKSYKIT